MTPEQEPGLVERAKQGDKEVFARLAEHYRSALYGFCFRMLGNKEAAEDAVQTTFLNALNKVATLREIDRFRSWLYQIARRVCLDEIEKRKRNVQLTESGAESQTQIRDPGPLPGAGLERAETSRMLRAALSTLTKGEREAVILYHFQCLSHREIAAIVGKREGTVRARLHKGLRRLRKVIKRGLL